MCQVDSNWYALFVKTGSERMLQEKLRYLDLGSMNFHVPCRELRIRRKGKWMLDLQPMFPGYILVCGTLTDNSYSRVRQLADVYAWISDETGPLHIHPEEIALLQKLVDYTDVIRPSHVLFEGQRIVIIDGPLVGQEAIIRKVDRRKGRAKISISVFGHEKLVDIAVEDVGETMPEQFTG